MQPATKQKPRSTPPAANGKAQAEQSASGIAVHCACDRLADIAGLIPNPKNPNTHGDQQIALLAKIIKHQGWRSPIVVSNRSGFITKGHGRLAAGKLLQVEKVPVDFQDYATESDEWADMIADNRIAELAELNMTDLSGLLIELNEGGLDMDLTGFVGDDLEGLLAGLGETGNGESDAHKTLAERFGVPPFTVLDARQGYWQDRKRGWIALGIQSELGRGQDTGTGSKMALHDSAGCATPLERKRGQYDKGKNGKGKARTFGQDLMRGEHVVGGNGGLTWVTGKPRRDDTSRRILSAGRKASFKSTPHNIDIGGGKQSALARSKNSLMERMTRPEGNTDIAIEHGGTSTGTSIFDPVLCELVYRWFAKPGWHVLDPFAGGSVRGIVAAKLGLRYTGIDLRPEQIAANEAQARAILGEPHNVDNPKPEKVYNDAVPTWLVGDSRNLMALLDKGQDCAKVDAIFSCPPYFDLEVYSDDPADLSNAPWEQFLKDYRAIIASCVEALKPNRFACFVVGDIRDKAGCYRNLPGETIRAFEDAGARLYNEAILVTAVGSLPIRVGKQFAAGRKLGKTHQNVLVFYKGDPKKIKELGECEFGEGGDPVPSLPSPGTLPPVENSAPLPQV